MARPALPIAIGLLVLALGSAARAEVLVVDVAFGPGADFRRLDLAVAAASDGDVVLVRSGFYETPAMDVAGKSLTIVVDEGHFAGSTGPLVIRDLTADQSFLVSGLRLPIEVHDCAGHVRLEGMGIPFGSTGGIGVTSSHSVVIDACVVKGANSSITPFQVPASARPALRAVDATVHVFDSEFVGGDGTSGYTVVGWIAQPGANGVEQQNSLVRLQGGSVVGGKGAVNGGGPICWFGQNGGAALSVAGGTSERLDTALAGGAPGSGCAGPGVSGPLVTPASSGFVVELLGEARALVAPRVVRGDEAFTVLHHGVAGDLVVLAVGREPLALPLAGLTGALLVADPLVVSSGVAGAGGQLALPLVAPPLGSSFPGAPVYLQALAVDALGVAWPSSGAAIVLVPAGA